MSRSSTSLLRRALRRPELGAAAGVVLVWVFFAVVAGDRGFLTGRATASYLEVASELGIVAVAVALLMIAGEFDLSVGSVIGLAGMTVSLLTVEAGLPLGASIAVAFALSLAVGTANGLLVVRTRLPSFMVTLASMFILRGLTIGVSRAWTGRTQIGGLGDAPGHDVATLVFASEPGGIAVSVLWWLALAGLATWILVRTPFGNWIFACGGNADAARNLGVPVAQVKVSLFAATAAAACLVGVIQAVKFGGADTLRGEAQEFRAIVAAVMGGTLLTGGYGSAIGAVFGALIFGMVRQGIVLTGVDADWFQVFLGAMLLAAVLFNDYLRRRAIAND
jgi:simple sugar transport system permease protein